MAYLGRKGAAAALTSADIPNDSITSAKIPDDALDSEHYTDGSIDSAHLHTNAVFASSTKMLFQQTAAPTGWTKVTSSNDVALRVVSGSVGSGGSVAFETAFASQTVPVHTLELSEIPSHGHTLTLYDDSSSGFSTAHRVTVHGSGYYISETAMGAVGASGGGGSHGHGSIDLNVSYVDVIIATKD